MALTRLLWCEAKAVLTHRTPRKEVIELDQDVLDTETRGDEDGKTSGQDLNPELRTRNSADPQVEILRAELEQMRTRGLEAHRRALLAENAGKVVPELVAGTTFEEMDASVEVARGAFEAARAAALSEMASTPVPAGNPVRQGPNVEGMSPIEKIAHGLKRD